MKGLKMIRKERNLNQLKVAMDLNISREALSHYENGKREPSIDMLNKLSEYFNVSIDFLINGKEFLKKFAFICRLSFDVYVKKLIIEKMVDELSGGRKPEKEEEKEKKK